MESDYNEIKKSVALVEADVESNCKQHGIRGILEHSDIEKMVALYQEEDRQARIYGRFQHLTGLVFKKFNTKYHVIKPFSILPRDYVVVERLDPHPRNPDAVLWVAIDKHGTKYVVDELYGEFSTEELIYRILQKAGQYRILDRKIDPSAFTVDQHTNNSLAKRILELSNYKLRYSEGSKERAKAIRRISDALTVTTITSPTGQEIITKPPELYFFDTCQRTIWEMQHWQYHEYTGIASERHSQSEKPQDKDDHMIENLGRALIDEPRFEDMADFYSGMQSAIESILPKTDPY